MHELSVHDLLELFGHFCSLSLLAVGGAITTAPDMHRYLVTERGWLTDMQFTDSIALAQAAPGPNLLFVAVMGWNAAGAWGVVATMLGIMLPSTTLTLWATRWQIANRERRAVQAFTTAMAPMTIGLLLATVWLLAEPSLQALWPLKWSSLSRAGHSIVGIVLLAFTVLGAWRLRLGPITLIAVGAVAGACGWV